MGFEIDWLQEHETKKIPEPLLQILDECLQYTGQVINNETGEFSVSFVDEQRIQEINREYRGKDKPTDVISFALNDDLDDIEEIEVLSYHLGDIVICVDIAEKQANDYGHSFERELCFLAVHGLLHLLGYNHETDEQEQVMFAVQEKVMKDRGLI
ncbi:rRNA maturation RNase YbeY [Desulfuribacillus alkaliarsenatis]|uniref:Endoribonuclease YbeY n=1 Tax=Desulfuribacillus alkaliarsenatis TaxID=766136 RepID=A0A1E5G077_9FIRM|nr:rRNA maturation RNase YbeY [Desulfuribacillus alkaliarsenatis]OEF96222.1 rRNA maturation RNase YbeY [Desulfuribacillus alkaliarsenatis]